MAQLLHITSEFLVEPEALRHNWNDQAWYCQRFVYDVAQSSILHVFCTIPLLKLPCWVSHQYTEETTQVVHHSLIENHDTWTLLDVLLVFFWDLSYEQVVQCEKFASVAWLHCQLTDELVCLTHYTCIACSGSYLFKYSQLPDFTGMPYQWRGDNQCDGLVG